MDYFNNFDVTRFIHYGPYTIKGLAAKSVAVYVSFILLHAVLLWDQ